MRLRRIVAGSFGALEDIDLGDLGDGLTVVVGPNESGKTTLTALVRHVLYGFPPRSASEKRFDALGGDERAALVFEDGRGRHTLQRHMTSQAKTAGALSLAGPDGPEDAEAFVAALTAGLSRDTYRSVFGFSIEELARIDTLSDIKGSLFASAAGLSADPHQALEALLTGASAIWSPRATRKTRLRELAAEIRVQRSRMLELRTTSTEASGRRSELERLASEMPALEDSARKADEEARTIAFASDTLAAVAAEHSRQGDILELLRDKAAETSASAERIVPDPLISAHASDIDGLTQRLARFEDDLARSTESVSQYRTARREAEQALSAVGAGFAVLDDAPLDATADGAVSAHEETLRDARVDRDRRADRLRETTAVATRRRAEADDALRAAGLDPADASSWTSAAARAEETARLLSAGPTSAIRPTATWLPWALVGLGIAAAGTGALAGQWIAAALGVVVAATGIAALLFGGSAARASRTRRDESSSLLGFPPSDPARLVEAGQLLDLALRRHEEARQAEEEADTAAAQAEAAGERLGDAERAWTSWATAAGLVAGGSVPMPAQARQMLLAVRDARRLLADAATADTEAQRALDRAAAFSRTVAEISEASGHHAPSENEESLDEVPSTVRDLQRLADAARQDATRRAEADLIARAAADAVARAEVELARTIARRAETLEGIGLAGDTSTEQVLARAGIAADRAAQALGEERDARDRLKGLEGALGDARLDEEAERMALEQASMEERVSAALDEYVVEALAARLLGETLSAWERDRQPEVLRRARDLFDAITDGAYTGLVSPVGTFAPTVVGAAGTSRTSDQLSRGTAEQLYLAVRIAYIEANLSRVNEALPVVMDDPLVEFDQTRREQTARAIAQLATGRQVILFTCHETVAESFESAAPGHTRLKLGRCRA